MPAVPAMPAAEPEAEATTAAEPSEPAAEATTTLATTGAARKVAYIRHGPACPDGTWAALPFWLALSEGDRARLGDLLGEEADGEKPAGRKTTPLHLLRRASAEGLPLFLPANPGSYPPQGLLEGYHVYLLDLCYGKEALETLVAEVGPAGHITILDHHATNERVVAAAVEAHPGRIEAVFDMARSGAEIAWDYARERGIYTGPESRIMRYVGDRDTWRWALPLSKEVNAALHAAGVSTSLGRAAGAYAAELVAGDQAIAEYARAGRHHLEAQAMIVDTVASMSKVAYVSARDPDSGLVEEYRVRVVNSPTMQSEIGHAAAALELGGGVLPDFAAVWYYAHGADEIRISLRRDHPAYDLSKIAPAIVGAISGGGHPSAAGCAVAGSDIKAIFRPAGGA